jgi:hypothetical protein
MKKPDIRKTFAILSAILTGGIGFCLIGLVPYAAEASLTRN